ncbi:hypothetical protein G210_5235 [Candida maltosa Xu316]|uniref:Uncharacterized protein n=1 Tax=Candida maltosa (strain Xu316) TaxID=1245528 RepID=M3IG15_CANMX|nr:hypothetical protein G210_5235 [Candida maltosa Xu316]
MFIRSSICLSDLVYVGLIN